MGHYPCPDCCGETPDECILLSDDFNRADSTSLGGDWSEVAGGAAINSNELLVNTNNSRIICTTANPDNAYTQITCRFKLLSSSSTARVFLGWLNTANYLYATISITGITIGQAGSTSETRTQAVAVDTWYDFELCWNGTDLVARLDERETSLSGLTTFGQSHGVGCGTASVRFDDFIATKVSAECADCEILHPPGTCEGCDAGVIDAYWQVEVTGVTDGTCDRCEDLNGLYLFDNVSGAGGGSECVGGPVDSADPCTPYLGPATADLSVTIAENYAGGGTVYGAVFRFVRSPVGEYMIWYHDWPTVPIDCEAIDGTTLESYFDPIAPDYCVPGTAVMGRWA